MLLYIAMAKTVKRNRTYHAPLRQEQAQMTRQRIIDAARKVLVSGTYSSVTMEEIAREAGVSFQTVYSIFGSKLGLAKAVLQDGFHFDDVQTLIAKARGLSDPEELLRAVAAIARGYNEPCADLRHFMRESGDPRLLARYREGREQASNDMSFLPEILERSGRLRAGTSPRDAWAVIWALTSGDVYSDLVFQKRWTLAQYEEWLGTSLVNMLLEPN